MVTAEETTLDSIKLYPNPNSGSFKIELKSPLKNDVNITIANSTGEAVYKGTMLKEDDAKQFELTYLAPGHYLLIIASDEIITVKKFVKK